MGATVDALAKLVHDLAEALEIRMPSLNFSKLREREHAIASAKYTMEPSPASSESRACGAAASAFH